MDIVQTTIFTKQIKKLHKNQKLALHKAIKAIVENPLIGEMKKGDLSGVQVYKFSMANQLTLLAYKLYKEEAQLLLISLGTHENFYRDLKAH